jgi:collagenase-like PrtC family protease
MNSWSTAPVRDLGDKAYLLSPQDLAGIEVVPDLIRAGIRSLKIEGRLKSPEYVAAITKAYRRAVDAAWDALTKGDDADRAALLVRQEEDYAMQMTFSRGLHTGWLRGIDNEQARPRPLRQEARRLPRHGRRRRHERRDDAPRRPAQARRRRGLRPAASPPNASRAASSTGSSPPAAA